MENASKALIMAATILISVAILSLGVYLFSYFSTYAKDVEDKNRQNQISQFNAQFLSYKEKNDLTIYDVITIANLAKDYNARYGLDTNKNDNEYITVNVTGPGITGGNSFENRVEGFKISENSDWVYSEPLAGKLRSYSCDDVLINSITKMAKIITITAK